MNVVDKIKELNLDERWEKYFLESKIGRYRNKYVINMIYKLPKNISILNVGDGTGTISEEFEKKGFANITAIDIEKKYLKIASGRCKNTKFLVGDARRLPFPRNSFDIITYVDVFEFLDANKALKEASRVIKKGGLVYAENFNTLMLKTLVRLPMLDKVIKSAEEYKTNSNFEFERIVRSQGFSVKEFGCLKVKQDGALDISSKLFYKVISVPILKKIFCPVSYWYLRKERNL